MKKSLINVIRWIFVLPGALASFIISALIFRLILFISNIFYPNSNVLDIIFQDILQNAIAGYYFVIFGSYIAPMFKKETALVLIIIMSVVAGLGVFYTNFVIKVYINNLIIISAIIGSAIGYYKIVNDETLIE